MTEFSALVRFIEHAADGLLKQAKKYRAGRRFAIKSTDEPIPYIVSLSSYTMEGWWYEVEWWANGRPLLEAPKRKQLSPKRSRPALYLMIGQYVPDGPPRRIMVCAFLGKICDRARQKWRERLAPSRHPQQVDKRARLTMFREAEARSSSQRAEARSQVLEELLRPDRVAVRAQRLEQAVQKFPEDFSPPPSEGDPYDLLQQDSRYLRGDRLGPCWIWIDTTTTTVDDIVAQLFAYLLQDQMVQWDEIVSWMKNYDGKPDGTRYDEANLLVRMMEFALPLEANALRPTLPSPPLDDCCSVPQAARKLGLTDRQFRYTIEKNNIRLDGEIKRGKDSYIPIDTVERLREYQQIKAAAERNAAKKHRTKEKILKSSEGEMSVEDKVAAYKIYFSDPQADCQSEAWANAMDDYQELLRQLNAT